MSILDPIVSAYNYVASFFGAGSGSATAGAEIDRDYVSPIDTKIREITTTAIDPVDEFLSFARIHIARPEDMLVKGSKDPGARLFVPYMRSLEREANRIGAFDQIPEGKWLNLTGIALLDAIHNSRLEIRRFIRRRFAPEGWEPGLPMGKVFLVATPKALYLSYCLYVCELIVRKGYRIPFADAPEAEEYD